MFSKKLKNNYSSKSRTKKNSLNIINKSEIRKYLDAEKSHVFKLHYTLEQKKCFANFNITNSLYKDFYGKVSDFNPEKFINQIGNNSIQSVQIMSNTMQKLAEQVCDGYNVDHCWISIRVSLPNKQYDIPRWHMDGSFFTSTPEDRQQLQSKFVTVLCGDGTLLLNATKSDRIKYSKYWNDEIRNAGKDYSIQITEKFREGIANILKHRKIHQIKNNEGLIFIVGNKDKALIHSEPPIKHNRIFISILPGTERQIKEREKQVKKL